MTCCNASAARKFIGARVWNSATQSILAGTLTALTFDTQIFDRGGLWTPDAPTRFTIVKTGYYVVTGDLEWEADTAESYRLLAVRLNGVGADNLIAADQRSGIEGGEITTISNVVSAPFRLVAGDYVELIAQQNTEDPLGTIAAAQYSPIFGIHKVG